MPRDFTIGPDEEGSRLETYLRRRLGMPRELAMKALRKGWVRVDGSRARGGRRLATGEVVRITNDGLPLPGLEDPPPLPHVPPDVVRQARASLRHEEADLLVSAKPAGAVVHRGSKQPFGWIDALATALGLSKPPTPVGRLDRDTSGLLVLAPDRAASRALFEALREGRLRRRYLALAFGEVDGEEGRIDQPLLKSGPPGQERVRVDTERGQPAATRYSVRRRLPGATLLEVELETGRTHQIRAHLDWLGHPLLGDPRYGSPDAGGLGERIGLRRLFLHAGSLTIPREGGVLELEEPLPAELERALSKLQTHKPDRRV